MRKDRWVLWSYIKSYKFNSIFIKNFLFVILPTVIPLIFISAAMYNYYNMNIREEMKTANINGLSKIKSVVDKTMLESDRLSTMIASDSDVKLLMSYKDFQVNDFNSFEKFQNFFKSMGVISASNDLISSVYVYLQKSDFVLSTNGDSVDRPHFPDRGWYDIYSNNKKSARYWVTPRTETDYFRSKSYISIFKPVSNYNEEGVVVVNIDLQKLQSIIDDVNDKKTHDLYITDNEEVILYSADTELIGKNISDLDIAKGFSMSISNSFFTDLTNNINSVVTIQSSDYNQWKYLYITPVSLYSQRSNEFYRFMMLSVLICLLIALIISFLISIKVFQPIQDMVSLLEHPSEWEGLIKIEDEKHFNEFKYVAKSILNSMDRTRHMEETLADRMELLQKAQGVALQAQINPHFLYNTLETINWKAMRLTNGDNDVSDMITSLSQLLRLSLETENSLVTIATEVEHAKLYLYIQNVRYRDKIEVFWNIDPSILDCKIVKLTVQPLIENSIYHGLKPKKDKGTINITGKAYEGYIIIEIKDDGEGIPEEEVERLNLSMKENYISEDYHIGMRNVNQRIKLFFGEEYGLFIESEYKKYTSVRITIPYVL